MTFNKNQISKIIPEQIDDVINIISNNELYIKKLILNYITINKLDIPDEIIITNISSGVYISLNFFCTTRVVLLMVIHNAQYSNKGNITPNRIHIKVQEIPTPTSIIARDKWKIIGYNSLYIDFNSRFFYFKNTEKIKPIIEYYMSHFKGIFNSIYYMLDLISINQLYKIQFNKNNEKKKKNINLKKLNDKDLQEIYKNNNMNFLLNPNKNALISLIKKI